MKPYQHRVNRQEFLNCPGFHAGAYVRAYVEDTAERGLIQYNQKGSVHNFEPRMILEIADCSDSCNLEFDLQTPMQRQNSFHKIDTLISALQEFREGLVEESALYKKRDRAIKAYKEAGEQETTIREFFAELGFEIKGQEY